MKQNEKNKAIKEIKRLWNKAEYILNNRGWNLYGNELLSISRDESKRHDRFRGESIKRGLTITEEAKYFAIKRLLNYLYALEEPPKLEGYHHTQKSVYMAYSLSQEFKEELKKVVSLEESEYINKLDYCELIEEVA